MKATRGSRCVAAGVEFLPDETWSVDGFEALPLHNAAIGAEGVLSLSEMIQSNVLNHLRVLDLAGNVATAFGQQHLALVSLGQSLKRLPELLYLNLARNGLLSQGAVILAKALPSCPSLKFLDVSRNNIRSRGAAAIADAIHPAINPQVRQLASLPRH